jgi:ankyrin repeat protein
MSKEEIKVARITDPEQVIGKSTPLSAILKEAAEPWKDKYSIEWNTLRGGNFSTYQGLKDRGARFNWVDPLGRHPLHVAAEGGNVAILADLMDSFGHDINVINEKNGETPILYAVSERRTKAIGFLNDRGADKTIKSHNNESFETRMRVKGLTLEML